MTKKNKQKKPEIVFFAGPNGSGKSTFTKLLKPPYPYINADEIKKNIQCSDIEASIMSEKIKRKHLEKNENFCFETVLSTTRNLELLNEAKEKGYFIRCYYIITADPLINITRVQSRVMSGGHDVPEEKIISRYYKSLDLMKEVIKICDICHIYDNSTKPFRIFKKRKAEHFYQSNEIWNKEKIQEQTGINNIILKDLNISNK